MTNIDQDGGTDDRRSQPPADPWLESAPTTRIERSSTDDTAVDFGTAMDTPLSAESSTSTDTPSPADAGPAPDAPLFAGSHPSADASAGSWAAAPSDGYVIDHHPRRDRRGWWIVAFALALLACLGGVLLNPFDDGDPNDQAGPTPAPATSTTARVIAEAPQKNAKTPETSGTSSKSETRPAVNNEVAADVVVYLVTSTHKGDLASVSYTDQDRDIIRKGEVSLPWKHTFRIVGDKPPLVIVAQRKKGGPGPVTCSISLGGKELANSVERGRYAAPQCSG